ncbi:MAG: acyl-ACP thioesterase domain-containing protein [Rikenellaceae bacterium]
MENYIDYNITVTSSDIDLWGYLRPTAILAILQEAAYLHSEQRRMGVDALHEQNVTWVLSRVRVEAERLPELHERIRVRTWHKGQSKESGLFSLRDFIIYDSEDRAIIRATSSWLVINIETRRITRIDKLFSGDSTLSRLVYQGDAIQSEAERVNPLSDGQAVGEHRVLYSDIDINQHVNNTKYLEWACDHAPQSMESQNRFKTLTINFNHEAKYGELVTLRSTPQHPNRVQIEGVIEKRSIFTLTLEY